MFGLWRTFKAWRARRKPFPAGWDAILQRNLPLLKRLRPEDQYVLKRRVLEFLALHPMEGCAGLTLTDEIRVTIAAQACLLLLRRPGDDFDRLGSILVYPSGFRATQTERSANGIEQQREVHTLGQSWQGGNVVLSWDAARSGAADTRDGHNVVLHEFAHQLDQEDGSADGAPVLDARGSYGPWARILGAEYARLQGRGKHVLDRYGATNPAEFFAVATEAFFEKPRQMQNKHPELYIQLAEFFAQDPASWPEAP